MRAVNARLSSMRSLNYRVQRTSGLTQRQTQRSSRFAGPRPICSTAARPPPTRPPAARSDVGDTTLTELQAFAGASTQGTESVNTTQVPEARCLSGCAAEPTRRAHRTMLGLRESCGRTVTRPAQKVSASTQVSCRHPQRTADQILVGLPLYIYFSGSDFGLQTADCRLHSPLCSCRLRTETTPPLRVRTRS